MSERSIGLIYKLYLRNASVINFFPISIHLDEVNFFLPYSLNKIKYDLYLVYIELNIEYSFINYDII